MWDEEVTKRVQEALRVLLDKRNYPSESRDVSVSCELELTSGFPSFLPSSFPCSLSSDLLQLRQSQFSCTPTSASLRALEINISFLGGWLKLTLPLSFFLPQAATTLLASLLRVFQHWSLTSIYSEGTFIFFLSFFPFFLYPLSRFASS